MEQYPLEQRQILYFVDICVVLSFLFSPVFPYIIVMYTFDMFAANMPTQTHSHTINCITSALWLIINHSTYKYGNVSN